MLTNNLMTKCKTLGENDIHTGIELRLDQHTNRNYFERCLTF